MIYGLMAIRFIVLFFISFLLLSPVIKYLHIYFDNPIIIIAQDKSESIGLVKAIGSQSNEEYVRQISSFEQKLDKEFEIQRFSFGENLTETLDLKFKDKETDFSSLFEEINARFINYNIAALIIATDGIYNKGSNPLYASKDFSFPIYTVALGDTARKKDLIVKSVYANKIAFLGDYFPIEAFISCYGFQNQDINLTVYGNGKELDKQSIQIDRNDFSKQVTIDLLAERVGLQSIVVKIEPKNGEFDLLNNSKEIIIDVVNDKKKILILANSVHPDVGAIRKALETNKNLFVESFVLDDFKGNVTDYQLVIFHQLPSYQYNLQNLFNQINQGLIPSLFILGPQTDVQTFNLLKSGVSITGNNRLLEQANPFMNSAFNLFEIDEKLVKLVDESPPLMTPFGNYVVENQADMLFLQQIKGIKTQKPMFCFSKSKPGISAKHAFIMGEGIWRWRIKDYLLNENHLQFDGLINKIVHFLALDVQKDRFMVFHDKIMNENEDIYFKADFYNQSFELNNNSDVSFIISNSDKKEFKYQFSRTGKSYFLNVGRLPVGNYTYRAKLEFEGKEFQKNGEFKVAEINVEHQDLTANHSLLYQLSAQTNGRMLYVNQLDELLDELKNKETIRPVSHSMIDLVDLIELKWLFFLIVLLLSVEWFLRKFYGSY